MMKGTALARIRDLRSVKVDQLTHRAMDAQVSLSGAARHADAMDHRYQALCESETRDVATLMEQTASIPDPATRLAAMNHIVNRVRNARAAAFREMSVAKGAVVDAEEDVRSANRALGAARVQFDGVDRVVHKQGAKALAEAEDATDEEVLETFAGLQQGPGPWV